MTAFAAGAQPATTFSKISAFKPILRGLLFAIVGFVIGGALAAGIRVLTGAPAWDPNAKAATEQIVSLGYVLAVPGWLLGVGFLETTVRQWFGGKTRTVATDWRRYLTTSEDHKVIGIQYLATFVVVLLVAGLGAMLLRIQLMQPANTVLSPDIYNRTMSFHGIAMVSVAVAAVMGSFGNYFVPIMIGARDMAFPRLNALSYWLIPVVVVSLFLSETLGGWDSGWTSYPPLSVRNASGQVVFNLAIIVFGLSSIFGALNFIVTVIKMRAPGMTWGRLPIFVWSVFMASWIALFFTQFFAASLVMVLMDRLTGTAFFVGQGGAPLLYEHMFWFYSHPAVYIFVLPGFGMALEVLAHMSRKPLFAYRWVVAAFIGIVGLSGIVWAHHMFVSGMPNALLGPFLVTTELISIPTGLIFLSALGTIWMGKLWLKTSMLFALGFVFNFVVGGVTGIFLADVPTDVSLHDTYFVVAHFHYTIIGGEIFALFAAFYFWFPKITGRMLSERLGKIHFWGMMIFFNLTFLPMFWAGMHGMNRRIATYQNDLANLNLFISIMAFCLGSSFIFFVINVLRALLSKNAERATANPWKARTLEWLIPSPPPVENFPATPVIVGSPYGYGTGGKPHAVFTMAGGSDEEASA
jgi:cytochrome c oxidase subunit 1